MSLGNFLSFPRYGGGTQLEQPSLDEKSIRNQWRELLTRKLATHMSSSEEQTLKRMLKNINQRRQFWVIADTLPRAKSIEIMLILSSLILPERKEGPS